LNPPASSFRCEVGNGARLGDSLAARGEVGNATRGQVRHWRQLGSAQGGERRLEGKQHLHLLGCGHAGGSSHLVLGVMLCKGSCHLVLVGHRRRLDPVEVGGGSQPSTLSPQPAALSPRPCPLSPHVGSAFPAHGTTAQVVRLPLGSGWPRRSKQQQWPRWLDPGGRRQGRQGRQGQQGRQGRASWWWSPGCASGLGLPLLGSLLREAPR
jgi:hypothetical protein